MKCIIKIDDKDIGETLYKINEPKIRKAVRTILFNEKGEIAILHKKNKNEYKLVGGGIEENENMEEALRREVNEEAGCIIKDIVELGYVEELRTINNFMQISFVFVSKVEKNKNQLSLTKQEQDEGAEICWFLPEIALKKIKECYNRLIPSKYSNLYNSKMVIKRDELILEYYLKNKEEITM